MEKKGGLYNRPSIMLSKSTRTVNKNFSLQVSIPSPSLCL